MNHSHHSLGHDSMETIAQGHVGSVSVCACGVITLTMQYLSLRFDVDAFKDLQNLLNAARRRLDADPSSNDAPQAASAGASLLH